RPARPSGSAARTDASVGGRPCATFGGPGSGRDALDAYVSCLKAPDAAAADVGVAVAPPMVEAAVGHDEEIAASARPTAAVERHAEVRGVMPDECPPG